MSIFYNWSPTEHVTRLLNHPSNVIRSLPEEDEFGNRRKETDATMVPKRPLNPLSGPQFWPIHLTFVTLNGMDLFG